MNKKIRILVLDCDHKNALAIVRHLGRTNKYLIDTASFNNGSIAFYSKYKNKKIILPNPKKNPEEYKKYLLKLISERKYTTVLPVSYISYQLCSQIKDEINNYSHISITNSDNIQLASSKIKTYELAHKLDVPYPNIYKVENVEDIKKLSLSYPCVVKAPIEVGTNIVSYAKNKQDLINKFNTINTKYNFNGIKPILQKFIIGEGVGFFAYYKNGVCQNYFVHKRIREYPITGGASTVAISYINETIVSNGKKILDYLNWDGVAMVEFKKDNSTGEYNLMEINAKFWGSLELAITSGINFPQMLIDDSLGKEIKKVSQKENVRFQWILNGDLFHFIENPKIIFSFIKDLFISKNDFYFTDILPNFFQLVYIPIHYYKKWFK